MNHPVKDFVLFGIQQTQKCASDRHTETAVLRRTRARRPISPGGPREKIVIRAVCSVAAFAVIGFLKKKEKERREVRAGSCLCALAAVVT